jgi:murein L,D-transpeptidase YcbB/YkuD
MQALVKMIAFSIRFVADKHRFSNHFQDKKPAMRTLNNRPLTVAGIGVVIFLFLFAGVLMAKSTMNPPLGVQIEKRFETNEGDFRMSCGESVIYAPSALRELYRDRHFQPAWIDDEGPLPHVESFLQAVRRADREGLKPADYHLDHISSLVSDWQNSAARKEKFHLSGRVDLELLLTDAFVLYGRHLLNGRVDPEKLYPDWFAYQKDASLLDIAAEAIESGHIEAALQRLTPQDPLYENLKKTLAMYMQLARQGGWPVVPHPRTLKGRHDYGKYLSLLQKRLELSGDLEMARYSRSHDESLKKAIQKFQKRHGLKTDGFVNTATLKELNVPVETRIDQIAINMERLRWLPEENGRRYILVNIADFDLEVMEAGRVVMNMPIVVGKQNQRTAVFSGKMTYIELNPYWNIPQSIAVKEILPSVKKDITYLDRKRIKVIEYWQRQERLVNPAKVDWSRLNEDNLKYYFRQDYGPGNALGRVKFMFPNKFDIYLHDTPERHLFKRTRRTFSHGCIRIARPIALAEYLLKEDLQWDRPRILAEIGKGKRQILRLKEPVDVHILYLTAWMDRYGEVQFRPDIYDGDAALTQAMQEKPSSILPGDLDPQQ